jgi:hypothetical protein
MNMTENRQLMLTVLDNNIKGDRVPYFSAREIENAIKTAYELAGIDEDHKQVPSYQQITCTLQSLIAEGLVIIATLPENRYSDTMVDYYALLSKWEDGREKLKSKCFAMHSQLDPAKMDSDIFHQLGIVNLHPEEIPPILFRIRLSMERMHPEISKVYFDEQFSKMEECVEWINDAIPFPTHKPHSPLVTEHAKHLSNLDQDYV